MKTMKISSLLLSTVLLIFVFTGCPNSSPIPSEFTITYDANDATSGSVPADQVKIEGVEITLAENSGGLAQSGYTFTGWNTQADGNGTHYDAGGTYTADASETLYAEWTVTEATLAAALDPAQTGSTALYVKIVVV